jgi:hypothetical protein
MVFKYRGFQLLQSGLPVFLRGTWVFVACKHLDNPQVFAFFQKVGNHALTDGFRVQVPVRKVVFKGLDQVIDVSAFMAFPRMFRIR